MTVNIDDLIKEIKMELIPLKNEYKESLKLDKHLDKDFSNSFFGFYYTEKCQLIYELKVLIIFNEKIKKYQGKIDLINHLQFKDLHFNSIHKTHDFLEAI